jgi:hypothetical protein
MSKELTYLLRTELVESLHGIAGCSVPLHIGMRYHGELGATSETCRLSIT